MEEIKPENILVSYTKEFDKICKNILHEDVTAQHSTLASKNKNKKPFKLWSLNWHVFVNIKI